MTNDRPVSKTKSMILGVLIFVGIPALLLLTHCGFTTEFKMSSKRIDKFELLPVQAGEVIRTANQNGNGEPFACEFRIVYGDVYSFKAVNDSRYGKKFVGICALLKTGDLARFRIVQDGKPNDPTWREVYWYAEGNDAVHLTGTVVAKAPQSKS